MGITPKTVFISYRRTNFYTALAVYQDLTAHGYDVFFDYESIDSGDFETVIFENIRYRAHFVVILSPSALERLGEKNSVMRREVELAIDEKRNIIPLMMESFDFGSPSAKAALTGKLESLRSYNGLKLVPEYIFAGMEKLRRFLNVELEDVRQPVLSAIVEESTEKRQLKASEEPPVQKEALTAEEWFERGVSFGNNKDYVEAIRCYSKAIELNPNDPDVYVMRGMVHDLQKNTDAALEDLERGITGLSKENAYPAKQFLAHFYRGTIYASQSNFDEAISDFTQSIALYPTFYEGFTRRGMAGTEKGKFDEAIADFTRCIELEPENIKGFILRGGINKALGNTDNFLDDLNNAILIEPKNPKLYKERARVFFRRGKFSKAFSDYRQYFNLK